MDSSDIERLEAGTALPCGWCNKGTHLVERAEGVPGLCHILPCNHCAEAYLLTIQGGTFDTRKHPEVSVPPRPLVAGDGIDEEVRLRRRLSALLDGVANALKGPAPDLTRHDWADLPERTRALVDENHRLAKALRSRTMLLTLLFGLEGLDDEQLEAKLEETFRSLAIDEEALKEHMRIAGEWSAVDADGLDE